MSEVEQLQGENEELRQRLEEETLLRAELERRCHLLEKEVFRDPATGLRTETYLQFRVREEIDRAIRYPAAATLITVQARKEKATAIPRLGHRLSEELRCTDKVFRLRRQGLAILLVETPEEGARQVLDRLRTELTHYLDGYACSVTSFPVDANLAEDFVNLALERHQEASRQLEMAIDTAG